MFHNHLAQLAIFLIHILIFKSFEVEKTKVFGQKYLQIMPQIKDMQYFCVTKYFFRKPMKHSALHKHILKQSLFPCFSVVVKRK